jgi:hypothetical protein
MLGSIAEAEARRRRMSIRLEHDPEKWAPVFGQDHAPPISWSGMTMRRKVIPLQKRIKLAKSSKRAPVDGER